MVEGTGLENRQARKGLVGSNPTPSANCLACPCIIIALEVVSKGRQQADLQTRRNARAGTQR